MDVDAATLPIASMIGWTRFFKPKRIVGLNAPGQTNRRRRCHLAVRAEQYVRAVAHRFANLSNVLLGPIELH